MNQQPNTVASASKIANFFALLNLANAVTVDDGAYLHDWELSPATGDAANQIVRFSWTDGDFDYSCVLTEGGVEHGQFADGGKFVCDDSEGITTVLRFFSIKAITETSTQRRAGDL